MVLEVVSGPFGVVGVEETKCIGAVRGSLKSWSLRHGGFPGSYEAASSEPVRKESPRISRLKIDQSSPIAMKAY